MSQDRIIADEKALNDIVDVVTRCAAQITEKFEAVFNDAWGLREDWDDDDFRDFCAALAAFRTDIEILKEKTDSIVQTTRDKAEMVRALHNLKI